MDIHKNDIVVKIVDEQVSVNLKWLRGANRYNNGATKYNKKYKLRLILGWAKEHARKKSKQKLGLEN